MSSRAARHRSTKLPLLPLMAGAVVVLLVVAVLAVALGDDDSGDDGASGVSQTQPVSIEGEALPVFTGPYATPDDSAIGQAAPRVAGKSFAGEPVAIRDDGAAKMILFVTHTCPHCRAEIPRLRAWLDEHPLGDVELYVVSSNVQAAGVNYPPSTWLDGERMGDVPTIADDTASTTAAAYGLSTFPYFVLVDADGNVAGRLAGELGETGDPFSALFDALASGEPITDPRV